MRSINVAEVLRALHAGEAMTLSELAQATGLARRTTELAADALVRRGLVNELAPPATSRPVGRPARRFEFHAGAGHVIGLSIEVRRVGATVNDLLGRPLAEWRLPISRRARREERLGAAFAAIDKCLESTGLAAPDIWAAAVTTPGLVIESRRVALCQVIPDWSDFDLAEVLGASLGCPVRVLNDTNAAAMAERWHGVAAGVDDMVWVLTGRYVRAALLVRGAIVTGADGAAGEIGWLAELGWDELARHPLNFADTDRRAGKRTSSLRASAATDGSDGARVLDGYARALAVGLSALVLVVNPSLMVLGGAAATIGAPLIDPLRRHLEARTLRSPDLQLTALGDAAISVGAVRAALDAAEQRLFAPDRSIPSHAPPPCR